MTRAVSHFDYPFSQVMYDPVLKVRVGIEPGRTNDGYNVPIGIHYDPEIVRGQYTQKRPLDEQALFEANPNLAALARREIPFHSPSSEKVAQLACRWETNGTAVRLKLADDARTFASYDLCQRLVDLKIEGVSNDVFGFYKYVIENYIYLKGLESDYYTTDRAPLANVVEICLNASALVDAFHLSKTDFEEIEPGWHVLARRRLAR